jgi:glycosyltransferase involved in cell wall biosynthesis
VYGSAVASILALIPGYQEGPRIAAVVEGARAHLPVVVVDDGSTDDTAAQAEAAGAFVIRQVPNAGKGAALRTGFRHALEHDAPAVVTLDADGQHDPAQVRAMLTEFDSGRWDVLIGSRYVVSRRYAGVPFGRRLGMMMFSTIVGLVAGRRVYDTTSGLKVIGRQTFSSLTNWQFVDFHAEAIVYLMRLGFRIGEYPITVEERRHGSTMYSAFSHIKYPLKTALMVVLGVVEASMTKRRRT